MQHVLVDVDRDSTADEVDVRIRIHELRSLVVMSSLVRSFLSPFSAQYSWQHKEIL